MIISSQKPRNYRNRLIDTGFQQSCRHRRVQEKWLDETTFGLITSQEPCQTEGGETHGRCNPVGAPTRVHGRAIDVGVAGSA